MPARVVQQRRVRDEGLRVVNLFDREKRSAEEADLMVPDEEAPANYVPAAAVIRRGRALFGITGRKGRVGGAVSGA